MRLLTVALIVAALTQTAAAEQRHPKEIQALLDEAAQECREADGKGSTIEAGAVRRLDLNGDGLDDTIVDLAHVTCRDAPSVFCGSGGCQFSILLARPDRTLYPVYQGLMRKYVILPGEGARTIRFHLHGTACDREGAYDCRKTRRIDGKPIEF